MSDITQENRDILATRLDILRKEIDDVGFNTLYMSSRVAKDSLGDLVESMESVIILIEEKGLTV